MSFPWAKQYAPQSDFMRWMDDRLPLPRLVYSAVGAGYPVPRNLNYFWNFGVLAGFALVLQIVTGIVLAMNYAANSAYAFNSVEHIMRDVNAGWMLRYAHMNGASFFFVVVYIHIFRGLYFGSYKAPREMIWLLGVVILLLMMATAFMGYVLPWGQMSFWGAQVITGFFSAIPFVGEPLRQWLLGGFVPDNATLNRFFSLHYLLPFVIAGVIILHIWALHIPGSNNPTGIEVKDEQDTVPFHPYYTAKDGFGLAVFCPVPVRGGDLLRAQPARPSRQLYPGQRPVDARAHRARMVFPAVLRDPQVVHLQLPVDRCKAVGRPCDVPVDRAALLFLPWLDRSPIRSANYRPLYKIFFWVLVLDVAILGICGSQPPSDLWVILSQVCAFYYFAHFLFIMPLLSMFEKPLPLPMSITQAVLSPDAHRAPSTRNPGLSPVAA